MATLVAGSANSLARIADASTAERTSSTSRSGRPRLEGLTTLRFLAALHVILFHLKVEGIIAGGPWWYQNFAGIGYIGVNFFFVLSGFILVYTYSRTTLVRADSGGLALHEFIPPTLCLSPSQLHFFYLPSGI
jgi:hypothetical protein